MTLWTAGHPPEAAGLTVSSMLVAAGDPGRLFGLLDPEADLVDALATTDRLAVSILGWPHRALADAFAGVAPAPGGPFRLGTWQQTDWGPAPTDGLGWAGCRLAGEPRGAGWSLLVEATIEHVELPDADAQPLLHRRGRYLTA